VSRSCSLLTDSLQHSADHLGRHAELRGASKVGVPECAAREQSGCPGVRGGCPGVASLLLGWSIRLQPVFHRQSRDALKFALVVGDDRGAERQGMRCDQEIIRAYRLSRLFEVQP
jgi:hypothetical protein